MTRQEELRAMVAAATPEPWRVVSGRSVGMLEVREPALTVWGFTVAIDVTPEKAARTRSDARLIAAAPTLAAELADALDREARLREALRDIIDTGGRFGTASHMQNVDRIARAALEARHD